VRASLTLLVALAPAVASAAPLELRLTAQALGAPSRKAPAKWLDDQLARANALFAASALRFSAASREQPSLADTIADRAARDALAPLAPRDGTVHVFIVARLADIDSAGDFVGGVHWRYRGAARALRGRRYIIVSREDARHDTLAHELGHYFGLAHRSEPANLMTAPGRDASCALAAWQRRIVAARLRAALRAGELRAAPPATAPSPR
jgi:hypothetical protein